MTTGSSLLLHLGDSIAAQAGFPPRLNQARFPHLDEGEGGGSVEVALTSEDPEMAVGRHVILQTATCWCIRPMDTRSRYDMGH